jgi:hypothetical protein
VILPRLLIITSKHVKNKWNVIFYSNFSNAIAKLTCDVIQRKGVCLRICLLLKAFDTINQSVLLWYWTIMASEAGRFIGVHVTITKGSNMYLQRLWVKLFQCSIWSATRHRPRTTAFHPVLKWHAKFHDTQNTYLSRLNTIDQEINHPFMKEINLFHDIIYHAKMWRHQVTGISKHVLIMEPSWRLYTNQMLAYLFMTSFRLCYNSKYNNKQTHIIC